jgi:predicted nucleotidyltransferase
MLVKVIGGSTAFGLNTPESDMDYRGVFVNTEPAKILGLDKLEHFQKQETDDIVYYEVRKFFELLKNGNTGAIEILFTDSPLEDSDIFTEIRQLRNSFIDTDRIFSCLRGYMQGERRLANGERVGVLGSKRKLQLEKFGFSPKNFVQLFRLAYCGEVLFQKGYFPVNLKADGEDAALWTWLMDVKTHPDNHTKEELNLEVDKWEVRLKAAYDTRKFQYTFNDDLANEMLRRAYLPYLIK